MSKVDHAEPYHVCAAMLAVCYICAVIVLKRLSTLPVVDLNHGNAIHTEKWFNRCFAADEVGPH